MRQRTFLVGVATTCMALTACSEAEFSETADMSEAVQVDAELSDTAAGGGELSADENAAIRSRPDVAISIPRMAYIYDYGFRLEAEQISDLQERHADMCQAAGPYVCQIVTQSHSGRVDDGYASGRLELAVVADQARAFGTRLGSAAESAGGEQINTAITGEDLTKNMVDTEARLRSRIALRDRMMEVLRTRQGTVQELVEAERSVARINEEIDGARSWLDEMRQRVAFTRINIDYSTAAAPANDFLGPVSTAVSSLGSILGYLLAIMIVLGAIAIPVTAGVYGVRWAKAKLVGNPAEA
ncbi:DUF4349 domain-containing protein [Aurantiacibacter marinus]|uniref:DUF4349 domain-containing protein n=1 Tax=Aurantiacibacter marinus TaxID=874156 RepID=A0A0H0XMJ3_9SPHN|nr:DUF4349 domain-containing protein [Aurantiacibacter marinus]KLI63241.1 hypothetical protein AAV99_11235 [Aurantiacibacter marinus]